MDLTNKTYYAKGKRGIVYTAHYKKQKVLIKESNPAADVNTIAHEAAILQLVNKHNIGPQFLGLHDGALVIAFIEGDDILEWARTATTTALKQVLLDILRQCRTLDTLGISKKEMTRPYKHIIVSHGKPVQIDFDRALRTKKPQNVTQLCQWLTNSLLTAHLAQKDIVIDRVTLQQYAKAYKDVYTDAAYQAIVRVVEGV